MRLPWTKDLARLFCLCCLLIALLPQISVAVTPLDDDTEFVKQVYLDFLNRQPDLEGLIYWASQLEAGTFTRAELVEQYLLSDEFGQTIAPVVRLYFTYFLRLPDYEGLMFWVNSFKNGMSLNDISNAFAEAQEFIDKYGSLSNEQFVTQMYLNVYGRQPDLGGLDYWTGLLNASTLTRGEVMVAFSSAQEYLNLSAHQVYVAMTYMGLLRRAPDQEGFDYWVGVMNGGASGLTLIELFLNSDEYAARFDVNRDDDGDGYTENQGDCSDLDATIFPGAAEVCGDGVDQDCNGSDLVCANTSIVGTWSIVEYHGPNTCGDPVGGFVDSYIVTVFNDGKIVSNGVTFYGDLIDQDEAVTWAGSYTYPEDGGETTVVTIDAYTTNNGKNIEGAQGWYWEDLWENCYGVSYMEGYRNN